MLCKCFFFFILTFKINNRGSTITPRAELPTYTTSAAPAAQREGVWCILPRLEASGVGSMTAEAGPSPKRLVPAG